MLHHYATKLELISAVIDYAFFRHIEDFSTAVRGLSEEERTRKNVGITIDWATYNTREYKAYLELNNAARTDKELGELFVDKAQRHDRYWRQELIENFPEWAAQPELLDLSRRLTQAIMSGILINQDVWQEPETVKSLLGFLSNLLIEVREGRISFPRVD